MTSLRVAFIQAFSEAFGRGDTDHIAATITDDIRWHFVGSESVEGKDAVVRALQSRFADSTSELSIKHIISHGKNVAVNGTLTLTATTGDAKTYAFCHIIDLSGFKNALVKQIITYQIEIEPST
jgi:ketosteroid isomerase-like protein